MPAVAPTDGVAAPGAEAAAPWRVNHLGRQLERAQQRFDTRVRQIMAGQTDLPLALSLRVGRDQLSAVHWHLTRHVAEGGSRLTDLARTAGMTKQAMAALVAQGESWDLVRREPDPLDGRARRVVFTPTGQLWLAAYRAAVAQAQAEFRDAVGAEVATVVLLGLEAYSG